MQDYVSKQKNKNKSQKMIIQTLSEHKTQLQWKTFAQKWEKFLTWLGRIFKKSPYKDKTKDFLRRF